MRKREQFPRRYLSEDRRGKTTIDKIDVSGHLNAVKVTLPNALEEFVANEVKSGEFKDASAVLTEAVRVFRDARECMAMQEMRTAFAGVDRAGGKGEPTARDRAFIEEVIKTHRGETAN